MTVYADSSFLVSSYINDAYSAEADRCLALADSIWVSPLNRTEVAHAIHQYAFRGMISGFEANTVWSAFQRDCEDGVWIPAAFPERAWETADDLARRHGAILGIRTLDSLHIACALELNASCFWTFDRRQARLAEAIGLPLQP